MLFSMSRCEKQAMRSQHRLSRARRRSLVASLMVLAALALACTGGSKGTDANSPGSRPGSAGNDNANAGSRAASGASPAIDIKEPERYSVTMTISAQESVSEAPAPMLTQQLSLAKLGADRRWTFLFPAPLGQIVYLEKSGLKYIVLFERKQYAELAADALGFQLGIVLTPQSIPELLKPGQSEKLGLEPVNGRTAIKYRVTATSDASTHTDGAVFVDQETNLPLRSELNTAAPAGPKSRVIVEVRDLQLNPDRAQFDVPAGMKKVTSREASLQTLDFAVALGAIDAILGGRALAEPVLNTNKSAANKNASRKGR